MKKSSFVGKIVFLGFPLAFSAYLGFVGIGGCGGGSSGGGGSGSGTIDLTTTVTLPSSSSAALAVGGRGKAQTTDEVPSAGVTCTFYDGDTKLGECKTDANGTCTAPDVSLDEGDHDLFVVVTDKSGKELAGAMVPGTEVSSDTTEIDTTVNTDEDLAYETWRAACADQLGTDCVPGTNISSGIEKVVPGCIHDFIRQAIDGETTEGVSEETCADHFRAMRELHMQNLGLGAPVDMSCVMKGDPACQADLESQVGSEVSVLSLKGAIATATAGATASEMLDKVVESFCGDATRFETAENDADYQADPGAIYNLFLMVEPDEVSDVDPAAMTGVLDSASAVGSGIEFFKNPYAARAMWETVKAGGISESIDASEREKRMAAIFGAPPPTTFEAGAEMARTAFNMYGASNWSSATADYALHQFGPLLGQEGFRADCMAGGSEAFDNLIDAQGGMTGFIDTFNSYDGAARFYEMVDQKDIGGFCTNTFECLPPFICSGGKCGIGGVTTAFAGGPGTSCTANSNCATDKGFICDGFVHLCVYAAGQASGGEFAVDGGTYTLPTAGSEGAACTSSSQCSGGRSCIHGGCFTPPPLGFTGGAPLGAACTSSDGCASHSCIGGLCTVEGGSPLGTACTLSSQCASGFCNGSICAMPGDTTPLPNGSLCSVGGQCQSGFCMGGICSTNSGGGLKVNGEVCVGNTECQSGFCTAGLCSAQSGGLKADGQSCSFPAECMSSNCLAGICKPQGSLKPNGMPCALNPECQSAHCTNFVCSAF